jgi:plasmid stabilization system protein ParE
MEKIYRLTSAAERDLLDILAYTNRQWGSAQAEKYVADIEACLEAIVKGRVRGKPFLVQEIKIFIWRCKSHYIFFLDRGELLDVLAILHTSMDLVLHLQDRFG